MDPPVQLTVSPDGDVTATQGGENPFPRDTLAALGATREPTTTEIGEYRVLVSPQPDGQVRVTALSLEGYHATTDALRRTLLLGGLIIALLESAMAWWLAGRLVRPLTRMAATANQIADGALDTEVQHAGGSREVFDLSTDIKRMVDRLRAALAERERSEAAATQARDDMRRFLADVSHEIRTPLTALKGYSDLYERGMLAEPGALDRAMSRVGNESVRLHRLVNSMMELVRGGETRAPLVADVDVPQVVRAVVDDLRAAYPGRRVDVQHRSGRRRHSRRRPGPDSPGRPQSRRQRLHPHPHLDPHHHCRGDTTGCRRDQRDRPRSRHRRCRARSGSSSPSTAWTHPGPETATAEPVSASPSPNRSHTSITDPSSVHPTPAGGATFTLRLPQHDQGATT